MLRRGYLDPMRVMEDEKQPRRRYITWAYVRTRGGTPGSKACSIDGTQNSKTCVERFQEIFERERAKQQAQAASKVAAEEKASREATAAPQPQPRRRGQAEQCAAATATPTHDDDDMDEGGFQYTDDEEEANDSEVALGTYILNQIFRVHNLKVVIQL